MDGSHRFTGMFWPGEGDGNLRGDTGFLAKHFLFVHNIYSWQTTYLKTTC